MDRQGWKLFYCFFNLVAASVTVALGRYGVATFSFGMFLMYAAIVIVEAERGRKS